MKKLILLFVSLFLACAFLCAADVASVGAEFRWNMFDYHSTAPSVFRDFTVYCTVAF